MLSAQKLKKELIFNAELTELLDVLKGIASSEFRALEKRKWRFVKFLNTFEGFFRMLDFSLFEHPFIKGQGQEDKSGIIMVTSDEGFMGGLNTRVINTALALPGADKAEFIMIGERGAGYLKDMGRNFTGFPGVPAQGQYERAIDLKNYLLKMSLNGTFSRLLLVYPKPVSFTVQKIEVIKMLPAGELFKRQGTETKQDSESHTLNPEEIIIESSVSNIIEYLTGAWFTEKLCEAFEDSKLAEFSARTIHLEQSYQALLSKNKLLKFQYFRGYHSFVDKGMREVFSTQIIRRRKTVSSR